MTKNLRKFALLPLAVLMITLALVTGQNPAVAQDPDAPVASFPGHYIPTMDGSGVDIDCGGRRPGLRGEYVCSISQAGNQITVVQQVRDNSEDGKVRDDTFTFTLSGSGGGLDQDAVDARIATFARVNNPSGEIGDARIPASIARDSELPTTFGDLTGDIGESQIPASIARDSELPEQRVIDFGDNPTSPENNLVIALGDGHARIVNHYETPGANAADGGLADFAHAGYRGVYANDSAAGTQVAVGHFYFNRHTQHFRERTGTVLASAIFEDFDIETVLLSGAHYQGSYGTDQEGLNHSDEAGDVFFQTTSQKIRVTSINFSAGSSPQTHRTYRRLADAEEVAVSITAHNASGTAHNDIRSDLSTVEDRLDALDPVEIEAYSSTATYSRGSANSIVTHANHVWVYRSTPRNTNHDPEQFPQYWWKLDTPIRALNHDSATTTHWRSGDFFLTETGELRMATATISASPADIIADHTGADQEFLWLNEAGGGGTTVTANPSGTDGDDITRIAIDGTNYNIAGRISWAFVIDTLIVPELNQDAISTARIILEDSGLTHYLTFLDWTAANLDMIDHLPVGAHIGLRQGTTTRILEVEAEWDSTNARYQVININTGILSESASGTATELLLTAGAGVAGGTGEALQIEDVGGPFDIDIAAQDRFYDSTIDMPATADIEDDEIFEVSFQFSATGNPKLEPMRFFGKDWKALVALTSTQQSQTGFTAASAAKTITGWLRYTTSTGGQTQRNTYVAKGEDGTSLYIGDNNNGYEATVQVWKVTTASGGGGGGSDLAVQEEGTEVASAATVLNFTGTGATATASNGTVTVDISAASGITQTTGDARYLNEASNLSDLDSAATARTNLGLGTAAVVDTGFGQGHVPTLDANGDFNVSVIPSSISRLASPTFTGTPSAPTPGSGTNTTQIATTAFVQSGLDAFTYTIPDGSVTSAKLATNAAGEGKVPIDNTLQFDGSGDLGVEISTVIDLLDEDIRYYSTDTTREDAHQASKGIVFLDTSPYAKRVHSVEWDFEGDGVGHNYTTFFVRIDSNDNIDFVYGESETLFNVGTSGTHRFNFDSSGLRIPGSVVRLGLFITRTGSDDTWETKVYRGQEADDSPRQSYPDASVDFPFWRSARFASGRPEPGEHIDNYITNGEIYGYPKIRYTLELEHASLVGDGNISASHISSGSAAADDVLKADGSGGAAFGAVVVHGNNIVDNTIPTAKYGNETVTAAKMSSGSATDGHVATADGSGGSGLRSRRNRRRHAHRVRRDIQQQRHHRFDRRRRARRRWHPVCRSHAVRFDSATQAISLAINGQANSEFPLHDRNGDALHEDDLTANSVYIAISDADSWDILVLPSGSGTADGVVNSMDLSISGQTVSTCHGPERGAQHPLRFDHAAERWRVRSSGCRRRFIAHDRSDRDQLRGSGRHGHGVRDRRHGDDPRRWRWRCYRLHAHPDRHQRVDGHDRRGAGPQQHDGRRGANRDSVAGVGRGARLRKLAHIRRCHSRPHRAGRRARHQLRSDSIQDRRHVNGSQRLRPRVRLRVAHRHRLHLRRQRAAAGDGGGGVRTDSASGRRGGA